MNEIKKEEKNTLTKLDFNECDTSVRYAKNSVGNLRQQIIAFKWLLFEFLYICCL